MAEGYNQDSGLGKSYEIYSTGRQSDMESMNYIRGEVILGNFLFRNIL